MRKLIIGLLFLAVYLPTCEKLNAQQTNVINGNIKNSQTKENLPAVSVMIKGSSTGTFSDDKGNFKLVATQNPPFTIVISSIGYSGKEINVESTGQTINIELDATYALGQEIVGSLFTVIIEWSAAS